MAFDPVGFLATARRLDAAGSPGPESDLRTAHGRAYYSAYLYARERLKSIGRKCPRGTQSHKWLLDQFRNAQTSEVRTLGRRLGGLYEARLDADYELDKQADFTPGSGHRAAVRSEHWMLT